MYFAPGLQFLKMAGSDTRGPLREILSPGVSSMLTPLQHRARLIPPKEDANCKQTLR
jgi:hypothetical protein